jgi:hypothetical protein
MAALSAAEQATAVLPIPCPVVTLQNFDGDGCEYGISLYFRGCPEGVFAFADAFGVEVDEHEDAKGQSHIRAHAVMFGHRLDAWWLGAPAEALVGLPSAWSAVSA